eukprot:623006-Ditylum_brightwellii.AAC.1
MPKLKNTSLDKTNAARFGCSVRRATLMLIIEQKMQASLEKEKKKTVEKAKKADMKSKQSKKAAAALESPTKKNRDKQLFTSRYPSRNIGPIKNP